MDSETNFKAVATPGATHLDLDLMESKGPAVPIRAAETPEELKLENTRLKQRILMLSVRLANLQKREEHFDQMRLEHTRHTIDDLMRMDVIVAVPDKLDQFKLALGLTP